MKRYPFSLKNAHDVEIYKNRLFNAAHDLEVAGLGNTEMYKITIARYEKVIEILLAFQDTRRGNVAWLTGEQYGFAKYCVAWAEEERARKNHN